MSEIVLGPHPDFPSLQVVYSQTMKLGQVKPPPTRQFLADYYQANYRKRRGEKPTPAYIAFMQQRANVQCQFIEKYSNSQRIESVLDIGCGAGMLLQAFSERASILVGYETDKVMAKWASRNLSDTATIKHEHFEPDLPVEQQFDLIAMSHVFEHVLDPQTFLLHLQKWLRPNGLLFLEVPNDPLPLVKFQVERKYTGLGHLSYFSMDSLANVAKEQGFNVLKVATYGPTVEAYMQYMASNDKFALSLPQRAWRKVQRSMGFYKGGYFDVSSPLSSESDEGGIYLRCLATFKPTI